MAVGGAVVGQGLRRPGLQVDAHQVLLAIPAAAGDHMAVAQAGVVASAQQPGRAAVFGVFFQQRPGALGIPPVQVPVAAGIAEVEHRAIRAPFGLQHRFIGAARQDPQRADAGAGQFGAHKFGAVPRHVGVIPGYEQQLAAILGKPGPGVEVPPGMQEAGLAAVQVDGGQGIARLLALPVHLGDGDEPAAPLVQAQIRVARRGIRMRDLADAAVAADLVEVLIRLVDEQGTGWRCQIGRAPVFVDPAADIERCRRQFPGAARLLPHERDPPGLLGAVLQPMRRAVQDLRFAGAGQRRGQVLRADGGGPGAVGDGGAGHGGGASARRGSRQAQRS